jgi:hypothetical protein
MILDQERENFRQIVTVDQETIITQRCIILHLKASA